MPEGPVPGEDDAMLSGMMMDRPLLISSIIEYAAEVHGATPVVSLSVEGPIHRSTNRQVRARACQLAHALVALGIKPGDRVATLAWNGYRHFELYYAISGIGAVCHTINPRLFPEQILYMLRHAQDRALFFDATFAPLVAKLKAHAPNLRLVALTDAAHGPAVEGLGDVTSYEELIAGHPDTFPWPGLDENAAAGLCYTSGTTGEPKGALYSHRSSVLHALFCLASGPPGLRREKRILPVVPLFHVNAWGLPYAAPICGASMVLPGPRLDGASLFDLMDGEAVNSAWGVPTVWAGLLAEMKKRGRKPRAFEEVVIGGAAAPAVMIEAFERDFDVRFVHGWGMTEMSPVGTLMGLSEAERQRPFAEQLPHMLRQGRRLYGVEMKICDASGQRLPHDGIAQGELLVRGPAVIKGYFNNAEATQGAFDAEGWFRTGDVARIHPDGALQIVDRVKDLVKSGGEWISSIDVENLAMKCPGIAQAALIAVPDEKWSERPLLVAVASKEGPASKEQVRGFLGQHLAKWQVPDDVIFVAELPLTATGKVSKLQLRQQFAKKP